MKAKNENLIAVRLYTAKCNDNVICYVKAEVVLCR